MNYLKPLTNGPYAEIALCIKMDNLLLHVEDFISVGLEITNSVEDHLPVYTYGQLQEFITKKDITIVSTRKEARIVEFFSLINDYPELLDALKVYTSEDKHFILPLGSVHGAESGIYLVYRKEVIDMVSLGQSSLERRYNKLDSLYGVCPVTHQTVNFPKVGDIINIEKIDSTTNKETISRAIKNALSRFQFICGTPSDITPIEDLCFDHTFTINGNLSVTITGKHKLSVDIEARAQLDLTEIDVTTIASKKNPT